MFGDVNPHSNVLIPADLERPAGAIITAPFGSKINIGAEWNGFENLVIDAAAAIGEAPVILDGYFGNWATVYSLHATKVLGIGEGAIVVFSHPDHARRFRMWTNFGFDGDRSAQIEGTNAKLSEILGAIGRYRLHNWESEKLDLQTVRASAHSVAEQLGINVAYSRSDWVGPYWIVQFGSPKEKTAVRAALAAERIETRDWWSSGCHKMPAFRDVEVLDELKSTDALASLTLGLPFYRDLTPETIHRIKGLIQQVT
jgi:dTDP-4-amino-4,6-dideoxygalactose transaminase